MFILSSSNTSNFGSDDMEISFSLHVKDVATCLHDK
jgi:hypothetical protein